MEEMAERLWSDETGIAYSPVLGPSQPGNPAIVMGVDQDYGETGNMEIKI